MERNEPVQAEVAAARSGDPAVDESPCHIYTYESPHKIFAIGYSWRMDKRFRFGLGSFMEEKTNKVEIIQLSEEGRGFERKNSSDHVFPPTKLMWIPDRVGTRPDLYATSGEYLRVWEVNSVSNKVVLRAELINSRQEQFSGPLTSFDWNIDNPSIIGTCSIDTTCTLWDVEKQFIKTQLIAHDKEVYDIGFAAGQNTFASAGADGSVRHFDIRSLEHSTILYESPDQTPFIRVNWNREDTNKIATIMMESNQVTILDIRRPMAPLIQLSGHTDCVNSIAWAPKSGIHISTAGDDKQTLIWDLLAQQSSTGPLEPMLAYRAEGEVTMLQWPITDPEWIAISFNNKMQMLKV